jgi:hypothetical protein
MEARAGKGRASGERSMDFAFAANMQLVQ